MASRYKHLEKEFGPDAVKQMQAKTVTIIGLGGIGSAAAELLVRSGIGVRIIEKGRVQESDMDRLSLFSEKEIDKFKATEAKKILSNINSAARIKSFNEEISRESIFLAEGDVILDCSGNENVTKILNKYCFDKKVPYVYGQVRDTKGIVVSIESAPCIDCALKNIPHAETEGISPPVITLVAALMVSKTYKMLLGKKTKKEVIVYDVDTHVVEHIMPKKQKGCPVCG
jgi:molybdopterin/thiamine biosynthesis adenylyltransferase